MKRHGPIALLVLLLAAGSAFGQASSLANCKYYVKFNDFAQGLPYCEQAIQENPEDPDARFFGDQCLAKSDRLEEAWESFAWLIERKDSKDKKIRKYAKDAEGNVRAYYVEYFKEGVELLNLDPPENQQAADLFRKASKIDPRDPGAHLNLGYSLIQLQDIEGAIDAFEIAVSLDGEDQVAREFYWEALSRKRHELQAEPEPDRERLAELGTRMRETLNKILEMDPSVADAHLDLADLDLAAGDKENALAHMRKAIDLAPESVVDLANLGFRFYDESDYPSAIDALTIVLEFETDETGEVWRKCTKILGLSHFHQGQELDSAEQVEEAVPHFAAALLHFEKLLENEPESLDYLPKAGLAARKAGEKAKGDEYLIRYEELKDKRVMGD